MYVITRALKRDVTRIGRRTRRGAINDGVNSIVRYYLNNRVDNEKQRGLDTVIGRVVGQDPVAGSGVEDTVDIVIDRGSSSGI
jgi:hypothetical protein